MVKSIREVRNFEKYMLGSTSFKYSPPFLSLSLTHTKAIQCNLDPLFISDLVNLDEGCVL